MTTVTKQPLKQENIELLAVDSVSFSNNHEDGDVIPWVTQPISTDKALIPNLEHLEKVNYLQITQNIHEDFKYCSQTNTYRVHDKNSNVVYVANELTSCFCRQLCGPNRTFKIEFLHRNELMLEIQRNTVYCDNYLVFCTPFLHKINIYSADGMHLGYAKQIWQPCSLHLKIYESEELRELIDNSESKPNEADSKSLKYFKMNERVEDCDQHLVYRIIGPMCACRCAKDISFTITDRLEKSRIGEINKVWLGPNDEYNWDHENFEITFPLDMKTYHKALLIGAAYLIVKLFRKILQLGFLYRYRDSCIS